MIAIAVLGSSPVCSLTFYLVYSVVGKPVVSHGLKS